MTKNAKIALFLCIFSITFILDMTDTEEKAVCDHVTHKNSSSRSSIYSGASFQFISMEWLLMSEPQGNRLEEASWGHLALPLAQHESSSVGHLSSSESLGSVIHRTMIAILGGSE